MTRRSLQLIREGDYAVEVAVDLQDDGGEWSPTIAMDDIRKLDRVRMALRSGDRRAAARDGKLFKLVQQPDDDAVSAGFFEGEQSEMKP